MRTSRKNPRAASRLILGLTLSAAISSSLLSCSCSSSESPGHGSASTGATEEAPTEKLRSLAFEKFAKGLPVGGTWRGYPSLLDFTGDGRADIVVSNREEDGWNAWTSESDEKGWERRIEGLPRDLFYGGQDGADVDGNGFLDLILTSHTKGVQVYLNDGAMNWKLASPRVATPSMLLDIVCANFNNDDKTDLVGIGHFKGGMSLYLGEGNGKFERLEQSSDLIGVERGFGMQVEVADLDGDGDDDILCATNKGLKVFFTDSSSEELSWNEFSEGLPVPDIGNSIRGLVTGDFNGDGHPEIGWCALKDPTEEKGVSSYIGIFEWIASKNSWQQIDSGLMSDSAFMDMKACDINNDGNLDLIVVETRTGLRVCLGDGHGGFEQAGVIEGVFGKSKIDVGDINADGWIDVLVSLQMQKNDQAEGGVWTLLNSPDIWKK